MLPLALVQEHRVLCVLPLGDGFRQAAREHWETILDALLRLEFLLEPGRRGRYPRIR